MEVSMKKNGIGELSLALYLEEKNPTFGSP